MYVEINGPVFKIQSSKDRKITNRVAVAVWRGRGPHVAEGVMVRGVQGAPGGQGRSSLLQTANITCKNQVQSPLHHFACSLDNEFDFFCTS